MALLLAVLVWVLTLAGILFVRAGANGMPGAISAAARAVDGQLHLTLVVTGIAFVLVQGLLGWLVWRHRARRGVPSRPFAGNTRVEVFGAAFVAIVFLALAVLGQRVWAQLHLAPGLPDALVVEVTGEQFAWNIRYPGRDGRFGRTDPTLYDAATNPLGIVDADPAGADDVVSTNLLVVPVGRPVELWLGSKDVLHSFFVPALRIKQDTVPGLRIPLRFTADRPGEYEVPCAELCGLGHYRMKGILQVVTPAEYEAWLVEQAVE